MVKTEIITQENVIFQTDSFFTILILLTLFGLIGLLLFLESIGYIHYRRDEGFNTSTTQPGYINPDMEKSTKSSSPQTTKNPCDVKNEHQNLVTNIDLEAPNPGDYMVPKKNGYYSNNYSGSIENVIHDKNDNSSKMVVGDLNKVYSGVYELTIGEMDGVMNEVGKNGINFRFEGKSSSILDIKKQILDKFNLEFISLVNKLVLTGNLNHPNHDYQFFKLVSYDIRNDGFSVNWDDKIFKNPPLSSSLLTSEQSGFRKDDFIKRIPAFKPFRIINAENEKRLKDKLKNEGNEYEMKTQDIRNQKQVIDNMLEGDRDLYDSKDINNFKIGENRMFYRIGREGTFQDFILYTFFEVITDMDLSESVIPNTEGMVVEIKFNVLKVYGVKQKELAKYERYGYTYPVDGTIPNYYLEKDYQQQEIDKYLRKLAKNEHENNSKCFVFADGRNIELEKVRNKFFCESYQETYGQNGVWDSPCQEDRECPYFKANKNYNNNFGGCNKETGMCQMPFGVNRIGFKKVTKDPPMCYNCNGDGNNCCHEQNSKNSNYSKMKSPDFVFAGDLEVRALEIDNLKKNGCPNSILN